MERCTTTRETEAAYRACRRGLRGHVEVVLKRWEEIAVIEAEAASNVEEALEVFHNSPDPDKLRWCMDRGDRDFNWDNLSRTKALRKVIEYAECAYDLENFRYYGASDLFRYSEGLEKMCDEKLRKLRLDENKQ